MKVGKGRRRREIILIVANDAATRTGLDDLLAGYGYETLTESSGAAALDLLDSMSPAGADIACVIWVDVRALLVEGYEFAAALRHRPATAHAPIICTSALASTAVSARVQSILGKSPSAAGAPLPH